MEARKILNNSHLFAILGIILVGAFMRLIPHTPNFAPVGALALFSGYHLKGYKAYLIPFGVMLVSDIFLGFHATIFFVYISFLFTFLFGRFIASKNPSLKGLSLIGASFISSIVFFLVTNWGVWYVMDLYPHNTAGLLQSYVMGLPFFRNTLLSDVIYSMSFFYGVVFLENFLRTQALRGLTVKQRRLLQVSK